LKTILPLSDELNDILGEVFQSEPSNRITVSELKNRIFHCQSFSAPPLPQGRISLPTPPPSPQAAEYNVSSVSSVSQSSYDSDEGSLSSSGSSSSDESEFCESPETSPTSLDVEPPFLPLEVNSTFEHLAHTQQRPHLAEGASQMPLQYYSLPQNGNVYQKFVSQCYQKYERPNPYGSYAEAHSGYCQPGSGFYAQQTPIY
jgi:hypothetical protein